MAGVRNLTQVEATERSRLVDVASYDITLDLTDGLGNPGEETFRSVTRVHFTCVEPGASTFLEAAAERLRSVTLNGVEIDTSGWSAEKGLQVAGLAAENVLVVDGDFRFTASGQGLHRSVDPVDKEVYLYSQFETADAQRVFACFDQPDLKSVYTWHVTVPAHWQAISNAPIASVEPAEGGAKTVHFEQSVRMSTYVTALCAGPYHEVRDAHDGIDLGLFVRQSMKQYLDADELFLITKQGFDFFHAQFGVRYPLPKYDQLWAPDFNFGGMENFGCVVLTETHTIFRSQVTDFEREQRANTILHELAHMWFGNLVTMRWWDDLWLNESFAEWAAHWSSALATRFVDAWATFLSGRKNWGYRQDQLPSTHPVYCEMPNVESVEANFDGITYAKGAAILKQLVAFVGEEAFLTGLRSYFNKFAWSNAVFGDLLNELEASSGMVLRPFASEWLETSQVNTLEPIVVTEPGGVYRSVTIRQTAPDLHPTLRSHRIAIGLYKLDADGALLRTGRIETTVSGPETAVTDLVGQEQPDILLLNDEDLAYTKVRLDSRSFRSVVDHISGLASPLARGVCWMSIWDMTRDGEVPAREFIDLICRSLPAETDVNLTTSVLRQAQATLSLYTEEAWAEQGWSRLFESAHRAAVTAQPGSGLQLAWVRAAAASARRQDELMVVGQWLDGNNVPNGLAIGVDLRWALLTALVAAGARGETEIEAELQRDNTAGGNRQAALARALLPTQADKELAWTRLTRSEEVPNWEQRSILQGFWHPSQVELTEPYVARFFEVLAEVWSIRGGRVAQEFVQFGYPTYHVSQATVDLTDKWLESRTHPETLRRLVLEGRDNVIRALRARETDKRASPV